MARDALGTNLLFGKARTRAEKARRYLKAVIAGDAREFAAFVDDKIESPMCVFDTQGLNLKLQAAAIVARLDEALAAKVAIKGRPNMTSGAIPGP